MMSVTVGRVEYRERQATHHREVLKASIASAQVDIDRASNALTELLDLYDIEHTDNTVAHDLAQLLDQAGLLVRSAEALNRCITGL